MKCEVCRRGPEDGISLYRENGYGVKGIWRCKDHRTKEPNPEVQEIVNIIEKHNENHCS
jgi:hypothetical protein